MFSGINKQRIKKLKKWPLPYGAGIMCYWTVLPLVTAILLVFFPMILIVLTGLDKVDYFEPVIKSVFAIPFDEFHINVKRLSFLLSATVFFVPTSYFLIVFFNYINLERKSFSKALKIKQWKQVTGVYLYITTFSLLIAISHYITHLLAKLTNLTTLHITTIAICLLIFWLVILSIFITFIPKVVYEDASILHTIRNCWIKQSPKSHYTSILTFVLFLLLSAILFVLYIDLMDKYVFSPLYHVKAYFSIYNAVISVFLFFYISWPLLSIILAVYYKFHYQLEETNIRDQIIDNLVT